MDNNKDTLQTLHNRRNFPPFLVSEDVTTLRRNVEEFK